MAKKTIIYGMCALLATAITVSLLSVAYAVANSDIDPTDKWAWATNTGWINFNPPNGGVEILRDHLEGYAWGENVGWIRLGTHTGGGTHTYSNTSAADYGVNRDYASGALSGYAWGTNVGWINFDPPDGGVSIDPTTGEFSGYAWGENIGWIHFRSTFPTPYGVSMVMHHIYLPLVLRN